MNKYKTRGIVYASISGAGLFYEIMFLSPPRLFLIVMYGIVILIGLILIFVVRENETFL